MGFSRTSILGLSLFAAACSSGGGGPSGGGECTAELIAGDLVISEVYSDPAGEDTGKEWFEIYNASARSIDLAGLELIASKPDGTTEKIHVVGEGNIASKSYLVFGGVLPDLKPEYVGYGYGADLGALRNSDGRLALRCNEIVVDEFVYETVKQGASLSYNGMLVPDPAGNDDNARWCDSTSPFGTGEFGTPGAANGICVPEGSLDTCLDGGVARDIVKLMPGDLVITELMPDPTGIDDAKGEWFEVYVERDVDLNGLEVGNEVGTVESLLEDTNCRRVTAGSYVALARNLTMAENGGLPVSTVFSYTSSSLGNSGGTLFVGAGGMLIDSVEWSSSFPGESWSLDLESRSAAGNDDELAFCHGVGTYGTMKGSPGMANPDCPVVAGPGQCTTSAGAVRDIRKAEIGDLVITEVMANPKGGDTANKEWFEVLVKKDLDLNGLQVGKIFPNDLDTLEGSNCLEVTAGKRLVFLATTNAAGSDVMTVDFAVSFSGVPATGDNRGVFLAYDMADEPIDSMTFLRTSLGGTTPEGKTWQLSGTIDTADGNDEPADPDPITNWCLADPAALYSVPQTGQPPIPDELKNAGTPGAANRDCP
jgi:Lamin Tail Domain